MPYYDKVKITKVFFKSFSDKARKRENTSRTDSTVSVFESKRNAV